MLLRLLAALLFAFTAVARATSVALTDASVAEPLLQYPAQFTGKEICGCMAIANLENANIGAASTFPVPFRLLLHLNAGRYPVVVLIGGVIVRKVVSAGYIQ
jgi:hypothetical protein